MNPETVAGWVWEENVAFLAEELAGLVGYRFDDWDRDAIAAGLEGTDADAPSGWFTYPLVGNATVNLRLANDPGACVTSVRVDHPADRAMALRIETILTLMSGYRLTRP